MKSGFIAPAWLAVMRACFSYHKAQAHPVVNQTHRYSGAAALGPWDVVEFALLCKHHEVIQAVKDTDEQAI